MSALRWLAHGDWAAATLTDLAVSDGAIELEASPGAGRRRRGVAVVLAGRPTDAQIDSSTADRWRRVGVRLAEPVPASAWLRIWTLVDPVAVPQPEPAPPEADDADRDDDPVDTARGVWRPAAIDALEARVLCRAEGVLWVAVELGGLSGATARIADLIVQTGDDGPVTDLPVAYRATDARVTPHETIDEGDGLLGRYLGLLDAQLRQTSSLLDELPTLLSPSVAPDRADAAWIERLADWVALDDEQLPAGTGSRERRDAVALAVRRHARRGTPDGLRDEIVRRTRIDESRIEIREPLQDAAIWRLDAGAEMSALGVTTGLVSADPGPPALDATAVLDATMLIADDKAGLPVHASVAHRICVHIVDGTAAQVASVDAVVQRERPAHVLARTCAVTRATGVPAIVGVDSLPGPGPRGLANDVAHHPAIDGPGIRIGTARLAAGGAPQTKKSMHAHEGEAP
jgi:phage tail-like protein